MSVEYKPEHYTAVTPYLIVKDAEALLQFMQKAFDAKLTFRHNGPDGRLSHGELNVMGAMVMIGQATGDYRPLPGCLYLYVPDTDVTYAKAVAAGGISVQEPKTMFYGDRNAAVEDANGNQWWIATHVEDISEEELKRRAMEQKG